MISGRTERVRVGWWYSHCCEAELYSIEDEEDLRLTLAEYEEDVEEFGERGDSWWGFWPTKGEALWSIAVAWGEPLEDVVARYEEAAALRA